jgi:hypothetical protein
MNQTKNEKPGAAVKSRAGLRSLVLGLSFFAAGIALTAFWFLRAPSPEAGARQNSGGPALSDATKAVLQHLGAPVEIRFYALLDPASVDESGREFAGRVDQLLAQYEQEAGGRLKIARINSNSPAAANAAVADGIKPFNMDKGESCYLGIAVIRHKQKAALSALTADWETALESDLSRAIASVDISDFLAPAAPKAKAAAIEAVQRVLPNLDTVSVTEGSRTLRLTSLAEFQRTGLEMQAQIKEAEARFLQAQNIGTLAEQDAALQELRQAKKDQTARLQEIALAAKSQREAFQQLKEAAH